MTTNKKITFQGNPLTLLGNEINIDDTAPDFKVVDKELNEKNLADYQGNIVIISVTPSLDTPVCDLQAQRFNKEATDLSDKVVILNVSMDLPFALARYCAAHGIDKVITLSDHREASFGNNYGVLIKELRLLARSIFIIGKDGRIKYIEIVPEMVNQPDYNRVVDAVKKLL